MFEELVSCSICPNNCKVNRVDGKIGKCKANADVKIANSYGGSFSNIIERTNVATYQIYNPRTDATQPIKVEIASPDSVCEAWLPLTLNNSNDKIYYKRDKHNYVSFYFSHITFSESTQNIGQLPYGYRPPVTIVLSGTKTTSSQDIQIASDGTITLINNTDTVMDLSIPSFQATHLNNIIWGIPQA